MTTTTPSPTDAPVLELLDPATLLVDRNIRTDLHLNPAMVASVKAHGVLVPITAVRDDSGGLRVRAGHRRTAAAIEAGLDRVPVVIVAAEDDTNTGQAERIVGQIIENHHRTAVADADTVAAVEQLTAFGVSVAAIARRTRLPKTTVTAAAAVAACEQARTVMDEHAELTLDQLAWVAELDDHPDLQQRLCDDLTRNPALGVHAMARLRADRDERISRARVQARFPEETWIQRPAWSDHTVRALSDLTNVDRDQWPERGLPPALSVADHQHCPGAVAWLDRDYYHWRYDDEDDECGGADDTTTAQNVDDPLHDGDQRYLMIHGCTQPHQHTPRDRTHRTPTGTVGDSGSAEAAADARKGERRRLIALNKAGDAAHTVRRDWLTVFSQRKTSPKDASAWLLAGLAARDLPWTDLLSDGLPALRTALGVADRYPNNPDAVTDLATTPARAAHMNLCAVLWAYDAHLERDSWRGPQPHHQRYLTQLREWGYGLAEVEQIVTGDLTPQAAYDAITV